MISDKNFVWLDLEMTGLNLSRDVILEIATIITDSQLNLIANGPVLVIHQSEEKLAQMDEWCTNQHGKTGLTQKVRESNISVEQAQEQTLHFIKQYCKEGTPLLAGNTIWQDRGFLKAYMPKIDAFVNYRMIDVTTVKELCKRWYPQSPYIDYKKKDAHRALEDIQESIEELKHYRKYFFVGT